MTIRTARTQLARRRRERLNRLEFTRALDTASPAMQQELVAAAARHSVLR